LFLKATITSKLFSFTIALTVLLSGCVSGNYQKNSTHNRQNGARLENTFTVNKQLNPPRNIQSVQLYKTGNAQSAPIIRLKSGQTFTLEFDYLDTDAKQFKIRIKHFRPNWEPSSLLSNFYQEGLFEDYITNAQTSTVQKPSYRHYRYRFPNKNLSLKISGNYMLTIYDYDTNNELFSLPFYIHENKGDLKTNIETLFTKPGSIRAEHQLFSKYVYPKFVEMPQFDLSYYYNQNQFWGRTKKVQIFDNSTQREVHFHISRDEAFTADYGFKTINLNSLSADGARKVDYQPEYTPPRVILRRDVQDLSRSASRALNSRFGAPRSDRAAGYADVYFSLEIKASVLGNDKIYLLGDFNNWTISEQNRMKYDVQTGLWKGNAFIKQGRYSYKYVIVRNGRILDLNLDNSFALTRQQYFTFIYYQDPEMHYDRLLQVDEKISN